MKLPSSTTSRENSCARAISSASRPAAAPDSPTEEPPTPVLSCRKRWFALGALTLAVLTIGFDITIMNVALPTMANELDTGTDGLQWIINAYILVFAGLLLPFSSIADRFGCRKLLLAGLAVVAAISRLAAWADGAGQVIAARALLGVGAAIIMPSTLAALADMFAPAERGKALSIVVMGMGAGIPDDALDTGEADAVPLGEIGLAGAFKELVDEVLAFRWGEPFAQRARSWKPASSIPIYSLIDVSALFDLFSQPPTQGIYLRERVRIILQ